MFGILRNHPYRATGAIVVVLSGLAWVAFGYFGVHTLVVDDVVSEAAPVFDAPVAAAAPVTPAAPVTAAPTEPAAAPDVPAAPPTTVAPVPEVVVAYAGDFVDSAVHATRGRATVLGNGTGQRFLRFEDFVTDNGPDLNVYLVNSSTGDVSDVVDLGDLRGNVGDQNYEIPVDVDLEVYDRVVIWCVRFGVEFGSASLSVA